METNNSQTENTSNSGESSSKTWKERWESALDSEWSLKRKLERKIASVPAPEVNISDEKLGEQNFLFKPQKIDDEDNIEIIQWSIQKDPLEQQKETPQITAKIINNEDLDKSKLVRKYAGIADPSEGGVGYAFEDRDGNQVGWVSIREQGDHAHLGFIGVNTSEENKNYGRAIIKWMKSKYKSISLTDLAYDTTGRGYENARRRLSRFYKKNGFRKDSSGFSWNSRNPALEDLDPGQSVIVSADITANGRGISAGEIMQMYISALDDQKKLDDVFGDHNTQAREWLKVRKEIQILLDEKEKTQS